MGKEKETDLGMGRETGREMVRVLDFMSEGEKMRIK